MNEDALSRLANWLKQWGPPIILAGFLIAASYALIPRDIWSLNANRIRAVVAAFLFGGIVGVSEIASRYRDEPFKAVMSPYGTIYCLLNGYISILALLLVIRFPSVFGSVAQNDFLAALTAGFGSTVIMRARIAIIKTADGQEESIGPDYVIKIIMQIVDTNIDRWRAVRRQKILRDNLESIKKLGDIKNAWQYLSASLFAFQNMDESRKKTLKDTYNDYQAQGVMTEDIKRLGLGFIFLTLVGESNFSEVIQNAGKLSSEAGSPTPGPPTPAPPPDLAPPSVSGSSEVPPPPTPPPDLAPPSVSGSSEVPPPPTPPPDLATSPTPGATPPASPPPKV